MWCSALGWYYAVLTSLGCFGCGCSFPRTGSHFWNLEANGTFSSKSCYRAFFVGSISFEPWRRLWKSWAPEKCNAFLWLAIQNKCWTADRLVMRSRGRDNTTYSHHLRLCQGFLASMVGSSWVRGVIPSANEVCFADWWSTASQQVEKSKRKGFNYLVILGA